MNPYLFSSYNSNNEQIVVKLFMVFIDMLQLNKTTLIKEG